MKIIISDESIHRKEASAIVTTAQLNEIVNKLKFWGASVDLFPEKDEEDERKSVLDDVSWFDDPEMGDR